MVNRHQQTEVVIIGGGPAGSVAGTALSKHGHDVLCVERDHFPRYVIGESLLPRCNALLQQVGMLEAIEARNYMVKEGAMFLRGEDREYFRFAEALSGDWPLTLQVPRDDFDQVLATSARRAGVDLRFGHELLDATFNAEGCSATIRDREGGADYCVEARFVLDCSGYGRVLPRLLDLERPALLPCRVSCFTQVENDVRPEGAHAGDIWICVHPVNGWIWVIPFSNGRTSIGMVCDRDHWAGMTGSPKDKLFQFVSEEPNARRRLDQAASVAPTRVIEGYSKKVERFHGERWALVGNASDFLDPVFSSGVTLAIETAILAAGLVERTLGGEAVDWRVEYDAVIDKAVGVFLAFIESWYSRELEDIFFSPSKPDRIKRQVNSVLGGHVLRTDNPLLRDSARRLADLHARIP